MLGVLHASSLTLLVRKAISVCPILLFMTLIKGTSIPLSIPFLGLLIDD